MTRNAQLPELVHRGDRSFTRAELEALSTAHRARAAIASQEVVAVVPGRYASAAHSLSLLVRAHAGTAATGGVLTGAAALFAWGAIARPPRQLQIAVPRGSRPPATEWLTAYSPARLPVSFNWAGVPIVAASAAAIDDWQRGHPRLRVGAVLDALRTRVITSGHVRDAMSRTPRIRDRAGLHAVLDAFDAGAHSFLEFEGLTRTFKGPEFRRFTRQHHVIARGHRYFIDMYDAATRTAVELDGDSHHAVGEQRAKDLVRDADLATIGILTVRFAYASVMDRPEWCRETVREVLRLRAA